MHHETQNEKWKADDHGCGAKVYLLSLSLCPGERDLLDLRQLQDVLLRHMQQPS